MYLKIPPSLPPRTFATDAAALDAVLLHAVASGDAAITCGIITELSPATAGVTIGVACAFFQRIAHTPTRCRFALIAGFDHTGASTGVPHRSGNAGDSQSYIAFDAAVEIFSAF